METKASDGRSATESHEGPSRRTFLSATGSAAVAIVATGLLSDDVLGQTKNTPTAEPAAGKTPDPARIAASKTSQGVKYPHLLSPIRIGNHVLKNRIFGSASGAHLLQGPVDCPDEGLMIHHANQARAGAAIVVISQPIKFHPVNQEDALKPGSTITPYWDLANTGCQNILAQLTEGVHFYGSLCLWKAEIRPPAGYDVSATVTAENRISTAQQESLGAGLGNAEAKARPHEEEKKELTEEMLQAIIDDAALQAVWGKKCGFDGIWLHCGYRGSPVARLMSPMTNRRTDKYGGSLENRARYGIEMADAIRKKCGPDFLIVLMMSGEEPKGGYTLDDGAEFAKLFTGHADILVVKGDGGSVNAPDNFITERTPNLYMTEYYKKKGVTIPLVSDGGFTDLDLAENALVSGKTDLIGACRILITNRNLIQLAEEGRNEDVVPCIRCNACHGNSYVDLPANTTCFVNPVYGLEHKIDRMISPPKDKKKIAVIGGGPAGMEAALIAAQRGHTVTLFEKTGRLGGTINSLENVSFKWPHKDFKNYLVRQISKSGVKVHLNTTADAAMIKREGYDAVLAAVGAEPIVPDIPGAKGKNVFLITDVYGKEDSLAKDVVVIGGGETGLDTGLHLSEKGHNVTVLEASDTLAKQAMRAHFYESLMDFLHTHPNCKTILQATCNGITEDGVTYIDAGGKQQSVKAGSVVLAVGMMPKHDVALQFAGTGNRFYRVGDCYEARDLRTSIRSAFGTASML